MSKYILQYNDENSLACVLTLAYYAARKDYTVLREFPTGKGFADIVLFPLKGSGKPAVVLELKWNKKVDAAIAQIQNKQYAGVLSDYVGDVILVGINYDKKTKKHTCQIEHWERKTQGVTQGVKNNYRYSISVKEAEHWRRLLPILG